MMALAFGRLVVSFATLKECRTYLGCAVIPRIGIICQLYSSVLSEIVDISNCATSFRDMLYVFRLDAFDFTVDRCRLKNCLGCCFWYTTDSAAVLCPQSSSSRPAAFSGLMSCLRLLVRRSLPVIPRAFRQMVMCLPYSDWNLFKCQESPSLTWIFCVLARMSSPFCGT